MSSVLMFLLQNIHVTPQHFLPAKAHMQATVTKASERTKNLLPFPTFKYFLLSSTSPERSYFKNKGNNISIPLYS